MTVLDTLEAKLRATIATAGSIAENDVHFGVPPSPDLGDLAVACFPFAKTLKKAPQTIATELARTLKADASVASWTAAGPYLNITLNRDAVSAKVLAEIVKTKTKYGTSSALKGERIMMEYVSPNTNKPLHLGHARNAFIGWTVAELLKKQGAKVVKTELVNDRGIHIMKTLVAYRRWANGATPQSAKKRGDAFIADLYVRFEKESATDSSLLQEAQTLLQQWEAGDTEVRRLWKKLRAWALAGHTGTYRRLGVDFQKHYFESNIYTEGKDLIALGVKKGVFTKNADGSVVAPLGKDGLADKVLLRADGTSLYVTQDLALAVQKAKQFKLTRSLYCVGAEQDLYLKQLFAILRALGFSETLEHLSYGLVFLPEGKMKSREGTVVDADDLLDELELLALRELERRYPKMTKKERHARRSAIALAALKYHFLMVGKTSDAHFDPKASLAFEGDTGPYLLYTYARAASILRKAKKRIPMREATTDDATWAVVDSCMRFPDAVRAATENRDPAVLAHALATLAQRFNGWYHSVSVLEAPAEERGFRLALVASVRQILGTGLRLLGIAPLEAM